MNAGRPRSNDKAAHSGDVHDLSVDVAGAACTAWETYRAACFLRPGAALVWVWSASHEFDLGPVVHLLDQMPGARLDVGTHAVALVMPHLLDPALQEWHLVPLPRLKASSRAAIQPAAATDLTRQVQTLLEEQQAAQTQLTELWSRANLWRLLPGSESAASH